MLKPIEFVNDGFFVLTNNEYYKNTMNYNIILLK